MDWDKTFPKSEAVDHRDVTFHTSYGITLAADFYQTKGASGILAVIAVCGPFDKLEQFFTKYLLKKSFAWGVILMAHALDRFGILKENLIDAGCDKDTVDACLALVKNGNTADILPLLTKHRESLRETVHTRQNQIDCLDFLVYSIEKELRAN